MVLDHRPRRLRARRRWRHPSVRRRAAGHRQHGVAGRGHRTRSRAFVQQHAVGGGRIHARRFRRGPPLRRCTGSAWRGSLGHRHRSGARPARRRPRAAGERVHARLLGRHPCLRRCARCDAAGAMARPGHGGLDGRVDTRPNRHAGRMAAGPPRRGLCVGQRARACAVADMGDLGHRSRPRGRWERRWQHRAPDPRRHAVERRLGRLLQPARHALGVGERRRGDLSRLEDRLPVIRPRDGVLPFRLWVHHAGDDRGAHRMVQRERRHIQLGAQGARPLDVHRHEPGPVVDCGPGVGRTSRDRGHEPAQGNDALRRSDGSKRRVRLLDE